MPQIISILNHKGGTGKTTTTVNLGAALNRLGFSTLVIDMDPQANLSQSLGVEDASTTITELFSAQIDRLPIVNVKEQFDLVPASLQLSAIEPALYSNIKSYLMLKKHLDVTRDNYDFILIDCPPSLGILTQNALIASNNVLITVQSQYLALKGLETVYGLIASIRENLNPSIDVLGILITQVNHTRLSREISENLRATFKDKVFNTYIRQSVSLAEASLHRMDVFGYSPDSFGALDYLQLANEIIE
ncbi:MAG TPA: ParA family protein [Chryseosolibacter sp.]